MEFLSSISVNELPELIKSDVHYQIAVGVLIAIILLIIVLIAVLARKSKKPRVGVPLKMTVLKGVCRTKTDVFYLDERLSIGSGKKCDIRLEGDGIDELHAYIVRRDGRILVQEAESAGRIYVEGMRIQNWNPLRSGNVISIGNVDFHLTFEE